MTEFFPDDVFAEIDLGEADLPGGEMPMDAPPDGTHSEMVDETELTAREFRFEEIDLVVSEIGGSTTNLVLPNPFQPETGLGAAAAFGGWLARRRAGRSGAPDGKPR
jgi:hypothetical protein